MLSFPDECPLWPHDGLHRRIDDFPSLFLPLHFFWCFFDWGRKFPWAFLKSRSGEAFLIPDPANTAILSHTHTQSTCIQNTCTLYIYLIYIHMTLPLS